MGQGPTAFTARGFRSGAPDDVEAVRTRVRRLLVFQTPPIPGSDREDLEQEILMQIWERLDHTTFDRDRELGGFVTVVTTRRVIDWRRGRRRTVPLDESPDGTMARLDPAISHLHAREIARRLVEKLSETCRRILHFRFEHGLSYREMTDHLPQSEGALRVRLHRCLAEARQTLDAAPTSSGDSS